MFCENCGAKIEADSSFCVQCGAKVLRQPNVECIGDCISVSKKNNSKKLKVILIVVGALLLIWILFGLIAEPDYIEQVQDGTLMSYDYGKTIGDSLNDWFAGNVTWDSYEEYGTVYVTATGVCPYMEGVYDTRQTFLFMIVDDEHFRFLGACGSDGYDIFTQSSNGLIDAYAGFYSALGVDLHELALKAAFGDQEALSGFQGN